MLMGGDSSKVAQEFTRLESGAAKLGLTLNRSKCEVAGLTDMTCLILAARGVTVKEVAMDDWFYLVFRFYKPERSITWKLAGIKCVITCRH